MSEMQYLNSNDLGRGMVVLYDTGFRDKKGQPRIYSLRFGQVGYGSTILGACVKQSDDRSAPLGASRHVYGNRLVAFVDDIVTEQGEPLLPESISSLIPIEHERERAYVPVDYVTQDMWTKLRQHFIPTVSQ